jgi:large subunit ribosomal protein L18
MINKPARAIARTKRHQRIRNHIAGTSQRPRLAVFRSNKYIYVQAIDDEAGITIAAASSSDKAIKDGAKSTSNIEAAAAVGKVIGEKLKAKGIAEVVFDRGGYIYHGKVKALADAAREAGIQF